MEFTQIKKERSKGKNKRTLKALEENNAEMEKHFPITDLYRGWVLSTDESPPPLF